MSNILSVNDVSSIVDLAQKILQNSKNVAITQAWKVLQFAIAEVIQSIEINNPTLKGADKKTLAMTMLGNFYDQVFKIVNFPFAPAFLQPIIQKYVKQLLMILVSASIDSLVSIFRQTGVFEDPSNKVDPEIDAAPKVSDK